MTYLDRAPAVAYLRTDISGTASEWDEQRMHRLAIRRGYEIQETITGTTRCLILLMEKIRINKAEAVFTPSAEHLAGQVDQVVEEASEVIYLDGSSEARWSSIATALVKDTEPRPGTVAEP